MRADVDKAISDLVAIRKMRGLSIEDVSGLSEIGERSLRAYEDRKRLPSALRLSQWAEVFGCQIMLMPRQ
jgi:transcriptional regulator with XRE-family HTH domain